MIFFTSWDSLLRILVIGVLSYVGLIIMLKISGNRTLSQMNSFDFIITIAMGSTFSSGLLDKNVSLTDTLLALMLLIVMQFILTRLTVKFRLIDSLVKANPVLLFHQGKFLYQNMQKERVSKDEMLASMRECGLSTLSQVEVIVLETNGKLSAIPKQLSPLDEIESDSKSYSDVENIPQ